MELSIIIVNYKTPQLVIQCINSIIQHTIGIDYEIIVVDNASMDDSKYIISNKHPSAKYLQLDNNYGFGYANNRGVEHSNGDYILFLNSDTIIIDNSIKNLLDYLKKHSTEVGICGGNLFDANMNPNSSFTRIFPGLINEFCLLSGNILPRLLYGNNLSFNHTQHELVVARLSGADMLIQKSLFLDIGGFDENYFMYSEETDLMFRLRKKGYKAICIPESQIIHLEGRSCSLALNKTKWGLISRDRFLNKRYPPIFVFICNLMHCFTCLLFIIKGFFTRNNDIVINWVYVLKNIFKIKRYDSYN